MLNTKDIAILREMFLEQENRFDQKLAVQESRLDQKLAENFGIQESRFDQKFDDLQVHLRDEIHSTVKASEAGLIREIRGTEARILDAVGSMMDIQIAPRLDEHDEAFVMVKRHLKLA